MPVGEEFLGFPSSGLWMVKGRSNQLIGKFGELPDDPLPLAQLELKRDEAVSAAYELLRCWPDQPMSANDFVTGIFQAMTQEAIDDD